MAKNFKLRFFLLTMFLSMLLLSATPYFLPAAHASEPTLQEKSVSILNNVAGIDIAEYTVTSRKAPTYQYFDVLSEDNVRCTLESQNSKVDVLYTFAKGKLHIMHVLETEGSPSMTKQAPSIAAMAKSFLNDYTSFSGDPIYSALSLMLNRVDTSKNSTVTVENVKLQVNATTDKVTFSWIYTSNGIDAAEKRVALSYKNGFLKYFLDTWSLYKVGSTAVNLSKEEAVAMAMQRAKTFSYKVGSGDETLVVKDFNVTRAVVTQLLFCSSIGMDKARGEDALVLYPMWHIGVGLDKFYPGNVYGIYVDIWADTKEVKAVQEVFSTLPPELAGSELFDEDTAGTVDIQESGSEVQSDFASSAWAVFAVISVIFGAVPIWLRLKKSSWRYRDFPVLRFSSVAVGLLCLLLFSVSLLAAIPIVKADSRCATIWGDRDVGYSWSKPKIEQDNQTELAIDLANMFNAKGYDANNYQGEYTTKSNILAHTYSSEQNYDKTAVVFFDHGIGDNITEDYGNWHFRVIDNYNVSVYDMEIFDETQGKTFFALINTCLSADVWSYNQGPYPSPSTTIRGMPYAWTHQLVWSEMSYYGYADPYGDSCYLGFTFGAASLSQYVDDDYPERWYGMWVYSFFWFALYNDITVNNALDSASQMLYEKDFDETDLYNGFQAFWGHTNSSGKNCHLVVFGDGDIKLYKPPTTVPITIYGQTLGYQYVMTDVYVNGSCVSCTDTIIYLVPGVYTFGVDDPPYYPETSFICFHVEYGDYYATNPATIEVPSEMTLYAIYW